MLTPFPFANGTQLAQRCDSSFALVTAPVVERPDERFDGTSITQLAQRFGGNLAQARVFVSQRLDERFDGAGFAACPKPSKITAIAFDPLALLRLAQLA